MSRSLSIDATFVVEPACDPLASAPSDGCERASVLAAIASSAANRTKYRIMDCILRPASSWPDLMARFSWHVVDGLRQPDARAGAELLQRLRGSGSGIGRSDGIRTDRIGAVDDFQVERMQQLVPVGQLHARVGHDPDRTGHRGGRR